MKPRHFADDVPVLFNDKKHRVKIDMLLYSSLEDYSLLVSERYNETEKFMTSPDER